MFNFTKLSMVDEMDEKKLQNAEQIYELLLDKIISVCNGTTFFCKQYKKKKWTIQIMMLLWTAQQTLNVNNKLHKKFIETLIFLKPEHECKKKELVVIHDFIVSSCLYASLVTNTANIMTNLDDMNCQVKFIEKVCTDILECIKINNKIKIGRNVLLEFCEIKTFESDP